MELDVAPTTPLLRRSVLPRPEAIFSARAAIRSAVEGLLAEDQVDDLVVAVSEACTNAIEAQLMTGHPIPIELRCTLDGDAIVVEVEDRAGAGFDPRRLPPRRSLEAPQGLSSERGWGILLMRELLDHVSFVPTPTGTIARLVVRRDQRV
jgi:anti-sigma regulatory factor (Ser/Thr protein kinase)